MEETREFERAFYRALMFSINFRYLPSKARKKRRNGKKIKKLRNLNKHQMGKQCKILRLDNFNLHAYKQDITSGFLYFCFNYHL